MVACIIACHCLQLTVMRGWFGFAKIVSMNILGLSNIFNLIYHTVSNRHINYITLYLCRIKATSENESIIEEACSFSDWMPAA
jgi:hypothetical protein